MYSPTNIASKDCNFSKERKIINWKSYSFRERRTAARGLLHWRKRRHTREGDSHHQGVTENRVQEWKEFRDRKHQGFVATCNNVVDDRACDARKTYTTGWLMMKRRNREWEPGKQRRKHGRPLFVQNVPIDSVHLAIGTVCAHWKKWVRS